MEIIIIIIIICSPCMAEQGKGIKGTIPAMNDVRAQKHQYCQITHGEVGMLCRQIYQAVWGC